MDCLSGRFFCAGPFLAYWAELQTASPSVISVLVLNDQHHPSPWVKTSGHCLPDSPHSDHNRPQPECNPAEGVQLFWVPCWASHVPGARLSVADPPCLAACHQLSQLTSATSECATAVITGFTVCSSRSKADSVHRPPASGEKAQHLHDVRLCTPLFPEGIANFERVTDVQGRRRWRRLRGCSGCRRAAIRTTPLRRKTLHSGFWVPSLYV